MRVFTVCTLLAVLAAPAAAQSRVDTTRKVPAAAAPAPVTGYGAWFGSIPNMDNSIGGILLDGVTLGSPAEKAGLKAGDTILKMGGKEIADLQAMVDMLRSRKPGDTLDVVFSRAGQLKQVPVILGVRPGS